MQQPVLILYSPSTVTVERPNAPYEYPETWEELAHAVADLVWRCVLVRRLRHVSAEVWLTTDPDGEFSTRWALGTTLEQLDRRVF